MPDGKWVPGTVAPLVLDSPFGQLDPEYRKSTATFIPKNGGAGHPTFITLSR